MAEASAKSLLETISRGHLECPICCHRFKDPKILDCLHSLCLKCLEKMMSNQKPGTEKISCPVCRRETPVPEGRVQGLTSSFFLISLVDEINKQEQLFGKKGTAHVTCESCEDGHEAIARCLDCRANVCKKCQEAHRFLKSTKDHQIIPAEDLDKSRVLPRDRTKTTTPKCREHIEQPLCFYCETCDALICSMCAATKHRSAKHKFIGITDAIKPFRTSVNDTLQKIQKIKDELASNEQSIKHARTRLHKNLAQARREISAKMEAEIAKIRAKGKFLNDRVNKIGQERDSEYKQTLDHNRDQMKRVDQIVTAVNDVMSQADDFELLELKSKVMYNLEFEKELKREPANLDKAFIGVKLQDVVSDKDLGEIVFTEKWHLKKEFGKEGTGDGDFKFVSRVACFSNGDIVVTDPIQKRLSLFTSNGQYKTSVAGGAGRQLEAPWGVAVTSDDLLFVTDKKKVKVFDSELQFVREFTPSVDDAEGLPESDLKGIVVDMQRVAVTDKKRKVINVLNLDGSLISSISNNMVGNHMAISNNDHLIFTNHEEKRLLCVDFKGNEVFTAVPLLNGEPANPTGVLREHDDSIYVALVLDTVGNTEVHHYDTNGAFIATVAQGLYNPCGMAFTPDGDVAVADRYSVKIFQRMQWRSYGGSCGGRKPPYEIVALPRPKLQVTPHAADAGPHFFTPWVERACLGAYQ